MSEKSSSSNVVVMGLGVIGIEIARALGTRLLAAVELRDVTCAIGAPIRRSLEEVKGGEVVVACTGSRLATVAPSFLDALARGYHVVSTCEELAYPYLRHSELARELDEAARRAGRVLLGTGVNPGFAMDRLVANLARACVEVESVEVERVVDLSARREALRHKVGVGAPLADWRVKAEKGAMGHVGLAESAALCAIALGWPIGRVAETLSPVVEGDRVLGICQSATVAEGRVLLRLEMKMGAKARDHILLRSDPPLDVEIAGGVHGDRATVGTVLSAVRQLGGLLPGLRTVLDLPSSC